MSARGLRRLAWGLVVAFLTAVAAQTWLLARAPAGFPYEPVPQLPFAVGNTAFAVVGAVIVTRFPRHAVGWLLISGTMVEAVWGVGIGYAGLAVARELPAAELSAWVAQLGASLSMGLTALALLLFPTGRLPSRRWRPALWLIVVAIVANAITIALQPGRLDDFSSRGPALENPFGVPGFPVPDLWAPVLASVVLALASLVARYVRGTAQLRRQVRWVAWAAALALVPILAISLLLGGAPPDDPVTRTVLDLLIAVGITLIPVAIGIAIVRHRLYDIDVVVNRTLVYAVLTAGLVGVYLLSVVTLGAVLRPLVGDSDLAVAGSTLLVAALFRPLRVRTQRLVDRRFYRRKYDAERTLEGFSRALRDRVDLDSVTLDLRGTVSRTVQPTGVGLWTRGPSR